MRGALRNAIRQQKYKAVTEVFCFDPVTQYGDYVTYRNKRERRRAWRKVYRQQEFLPKTARTFVTYVGMYEGYSSLRRRDPLAYRNCIGWKVGPIEKQYHFLFAS